MLSDKKAQSALEYMMTYGWAILIIVIVAVILYSMGIFNPSSSISATITGFASAPVSSAICTSNGVLRFAVGDTTGNIIKIKNITATIGSKTVTFTPNATIDPNPTIAPGSTYTFSVPNVCPSASTHFSAAVTINYTEPGSIFPSAVYPSSGTITGTVSLTALPPYVAQFSAPYNVSASPSNDPSYMSYTLPSSSDLTDVSNFNFTLTGWVYMPMENGPGNTGQWMADGLFNFQTGPNGRYAGFIFMPPPSQEVIHTCYNDIHGDTISPTDPFNGQWYFFAASVNNNTAMFQFDGHQYTVSDTGNVRGSNGTIIVGASMQCGDFGLIGNLADIQLYNTSLSATQLNSIYNAGITGSTIYKSSGLVAWWPLNGTLSDFSGHSFNLVDHGAYLTSNYNSVSLS